MSGTIFFICSTSAISAHSAALRISAWPAAPERWRKGCKNKKETTGSWQSKSRRRWTWPSLSRQVLRLWTVRLRRKGLVKTKHPVEQIGQVQGNLTQAASSSQGWQKDAFLDASTGKPVAPGYPGFSGTPGKLRRLGIRGQWRRLATHSPCSIKLCAAHGERLVDRERKIWSQSDGLNARLRCEHSEMRYIYVCHSASCSSSWERLNGKSSTYQESTLEIFETIISSDWGSDRNYWTDHSWLAAAYVERDYSVNWQSCSICNCPNLTSFLTPCCLGGISDEPVKAWERRIKCFLEALSYRFGSHRRGADGVRVETFPSIHNIGNCRRGS